jgi:Fic-DOC domain mobile mystery protein B
LIPSITTREDLNEFEQNNIENAVQWSMKKIHPSGILFTEKFTKQLHKEMFGDVWKWAGAFRKSNKNIGVDKNIIGIELKKLLDDVVYWVENNTFQPDEKAIRFKHRLVSIHLFPNGNGRHSRLFADIIISHIYNKPVFTWGGDNSESSSADIRKMYIDSLKRADCGDFKKLIEFARS